MNGLRPSAKVRIATTLVHAIGGLRLEIDDGDNTIGYTSEHAELEVPRFSPCELRQAVGEAMRCDAIGPRGEGETESPLLSLVRSQTLTIGLHEGRSRVYPGDIIGSICCTTAVFAFATTLTPSQVRQGSAGRPRLHQLRTRIDDLLKTTIVYIEVDLHHRLDAGWQDLVVSELQEAMIGCMRADIDRRNLGSRISN